MMVTSSAHNIAPEREPPGIPSRALDLPGGCRAPRLQAGCVRSARRGSRARHRAGRDAATRRQLRPPAAGRAAVALPSHRAERDPRLVPAAEGALTLDDAVLV